MEFITSRNNGKITDVIKLKDKKYRDGSSLFLAEGRKLFDEAIDSGIKLHDVFLTEKFLEKHPNTLDNISDKALCYTVSESVMEKLSENKAPEGILFTGQYFHYAEKISEKLFLPAFMLCSVRDPGNVGTVIRSSLALGIKTLILSADCADIYNSKTIRASMGAVFRQKIIISQDIISDIENIKNYGNKIYAAVLDNRSVMVQDINICENVIFAVGNEGNGIPPEVTEHCTGTVFIPMEKGAESLNASVAASLLMWEQYRNK